VDRRWEDRLRPAWLACIVLVDSMVDEMSFNPVLYFRF
jgi:uncharacterized membrane protein YhaH (DUF805 family)